jgi:hypothetical protein
MRWCNRRTCGDRQVPVHRARSITKEELSRRRWATTWAYLTLLVALVALHAVLLICPCARKRATRFATPPQHRQPSTRASTKIHAATVILSTTTWIIRTTIASTPSRGSRRCACAARCSAIERASSRPFRVEFRAPHHRRIANHSRRPHHLNSLHHSASATIAAGPGA